MKIKNIILFVVCAFLLCASAKSQDVSKESRKFSNLLYLINAAYVDTVNMEKIVETAIVGMLKELDPHSVYISKKEIEKMQEPLEGSFEGIGVQFRLMEDTLLIVGVISGGPSEKVGILSGDRILVVDDENIAGIKIDNAGVAKRLRGKKGTVVKVEVLRKGHENPLVFNITRDKIPLYSVDVSYITDDNIGYIKLNKFSKTTSDELNEAFVKFIKAGVRDVILDLTGNTGGYMDKAIDLCDEFLQNNKLIVYTEGNKVPRTEYKSTSKGRFYSGKLVVLVDEGSASASEIVSGAIQDWDRGVIVGRRTFGKGLVQREMGLSDGSAVRLTISRYYTPAGRLIQKPYQDGYDDYMRDLGKRVKHGELFHKDSIEFADSLKSKTLNKKRTVYGGGGIMPDSFVPIDTTLRSDYHIELLRKGIMFSVVSKYVDDNRVKLKKKYPNFESFKKDFSVDNKILKMLKTEAEKEKINIDSLANPTTQQNLYFETHLKALIAGDIWSNHEFWIIFNEVSPIYLRGKEIITNDKLYKDFLK